MPNTLTTIKINDKELLFVLVPEGCVAIRVVQYKKGWFLETKKSEYLTLSAKLPPGNWLLLGKGSDIESGVSGGLIEECFDGKIEDFQSLIRSRGHEPELTVVLIKQ